MQNKSLKNHYSEKFMKLYFPKIESILPVVETNKSRRKQKNKNHIFCKNKQQSEKSVKTVFSKKSIFAITVLYQTIYCLRRR